MTVEIRAIGFGSDKPECFADSDRCSLEISQPLTPNQLLARLGMEKAVDTIVLVNNTTVAENQWDTSLVVDNSEVTVMAAIEGG